MTNWDVFKQAYKDEARDAMDNRQYGPLMGATVLLFWTAVILLIVRAV